MVGRLAGSLRRFPIPVGWILSLEPSLQLGPTLGLKRGWKDGLNFGLQLGPHALGLKRGWKFGQKCSPQLSPTLGLKRGWKKKFPRLMNKDAF